MFRDSAVFSVLLAAVQRRRTWRMAELGGREESWLGLRDNRSSVSYSSFESGFFSRGILFGRDGGALVGVSSLGAGRSVYTWGPCFRSVYLESQSPTPPYRHTIVDR